MFSYGTTAKQRYLCRNKSCARKTFQMEYKNNACRPGVHEEIVEMAMNGTGTRDTGRVLGISKDTVTSVLKNEKIRQAGSRGVSKEDRG